MTKEELLKMREEVYTMQDQFDNQYAKIKDEHIYNLNEVRDKMLVALIEWSELFTDLIDKAK